MNFTAGAMRFVFIEQLVPESQLSKDTDIATIRGMLGYTIMMFLDVSLG